MAPTILFYLTKPISMKKTNALIAYLYLHCKYTAAIS